MLVKIGNLDITKAVQESTYKVDSVPVYENWVDATYKQHNKKIRDRVQGQFEAVCAGTLTVEYSALISALKSATSGVDTTLTVYITNTGETKTITGRVSVTTEKYTDVKNGVLIHRLSFKVEEN